MDVAALNTALRAAINGYAALNTWSNTTYSKDHDFLDRLDERDIPTASGCPFCALTPTGREAGEESRTNYAVFMAQLVVNDTTANHFTNLEAYRKHFEDAIKAYTNSTSPRMSFAVEVEYDIESSYPMLYCGMKLRFKDSVTIGRDPLN